MKYSLLMDVTKTLKTSENCFEDHIEDLKFKFHFCTANQTTLFLKYCDRSMAFRCGQNYTDSKNMLKT